MENKDFGEILVWLQLNDEARILYEFLFEDFRNHDFQDIREYLKVSKNDDKESLINILKMSKEFKKLSNTTIDDMNNDLLLSSIFDTDLGRNYTDHFLEFYTEDTNKLSSDSECIQTTYNIMHKLIEIKSSVQNVTENLKQLSNAINAVNSIIDISGRVQLSKIIFRYLLKAINKEEDKIQFIKSLLYLDEEVLFDQEIKSFYKNETRPKKIKSIKDLMLHISDIKVEIYYRGHASSRFTLVPSAFRGSMFQYEEDVVKKMMLETPDEFTNIPTHYEKLLKMQHYGIPTRMLDITTNPLVALFMACDGQDRNDGEVLLIKKESFKTCYPSSDKVKILSSIAFLPYRIKLVLRFFLFVVKLSDSDFNKIARPLLHEIKHEMPSFEPRMITDDLKKHLFVLGPKSNRRIYAQSGHFILSPFKETLKSKVPVEYFMEKGRRIRVYVPKKHKRKILSELAILNVKKHTMYPEIEQIAKGVRAEYL